MADEYIRLKETHRVDNAGNDVHDTSSYHNNAETETAPHTDPQNLAARVVWYIAGILLGILAIRFLLALLGANPSNPFANFIYILSYPFVAPFFTLFSYNLRYGVAHFEAYTLVAMVVYGLIAYAIARLITINRATTAGSY